MENLLLGAICLCPLLMTFSTTEIFEFPKTIFLYLSAITILLLWAIQFRQKEKTNLNFKPVFSGILFFLLSTTLSSIIALDPTTAVFGYYSRFSDGLLATVAFCLIFLAFVNQTTSYFYQRLFKALALTTTVICLYALLQKMGIDDNLWNQIAKERVFSTLGQPNWLAAYLVAFLPLQIAFLLIASKFKAKMIWLLCIIMSLLTIFFTLSATGFLGLMIAISIFFLRLTKKNDATKSIFAGCLLLLGLGVVISHNQIKERIHETGSIRLLVWQGSMETFIQAPLKNKILGFGPANFAYAFLPHRPKSLNHTPEWDLLFNKPHNEYLDLLINQGLLGIISFLYLILHMIKSFNSHNVSREEKIFLAALYSGWVSILFTSFFGFLVTTTKMLFFILPATALSIKGNKPDASSSQLEITTRLKEIICLSIFILAGLAYREIFKIYTADVSYTQANQLVKMGRFRESFLYYEKALADNSRIPHYHRDYASSLCQLALLETNKNNLAESANEQIKAALKSNPYNSLTLRSALDIYLKLAEIDEKYLKEGLEVSDLAIKHIPTDSTLYVLKAKILLQKHDTETAQKYLYQALTLKPDHPEALNLKKDFEKESQQ